MICHANTSSAELIEYLRDVAIRAKAKPAWIDAIDRLQDADKWELEAEELGGQMHDLKENFNALRESFSLLLDAVNVVMEAHGEEHGAELHLNGTLQVLPNGGTLPALIKECTETLADYPEQAT